MPTNKKPIGSLPRERFIVYPRIAMDPRTRLQAIEAELSDLREEGLASLQDRAGMQDLPHRPDLRRHLLEERRVRKDKVMHLESKRATCLAELDAQQARAEARATQDRHWQSFILSLVAIAIALLAWIFPRH